MDKELIFGVSALIVNLVGYAPYISGVFKNSVKPQRITWGIWTILTTVAFVNQVVNGGGWSTLFFGSTALLVTVVFVLSLKYGIGGGTQLDWYVLSAAFILLILWAVTQDTVTSTYLAVLIDGIGATPTVIKAYKQPETEIYAQWVMAALGGLLALLAVSNNGGLALYVYPIYIAIFNSLIIFAKKLGHLHQKNT